MSHAGNGRSLPDPEVDLVRTALAGTDAPPDPVRWQLEESGSSHRVVLAGARVAVRVSRHAEAADLLTRRTALVDALPDLPFALPRSVGPVVGTGSLRAVATRRVPGHTSPHRVDPAALATVLNALAAVDPAPLAELLTAPLAYGGGPDWWDLQQAEVLPRLPAHVRPAAERAVAALADRDPGPRQLVHGDLAGGNLRWESGRVVGVIDWDLATAYDPALDLACLAEWHGWDTVGQLADAATVRRARVQQACFALHTVAHVIITRPGDEEAVGAAVDRVARQLARHPQAPDGPAAAPLG